jgi:stage V sporulation protein SpoVS
MKTITYVIGIAMLLMLIASPALAAAPVVQQNAQGVVIGSFGVNQNVQNFNTGTGYVLQNGQGIVFGSSFINQNVQNSNGKGKGTVSQDASGLIKFSKFTFQNIQNYN